MMVNAEPRITNLMVELVSCNGCRIQACAAILALELFWPCIIPFFHIIFFKNKPPDIPMDMGTLLLRSPCLQVPSSSLLAFLVLWMLTFPSLSHTHQHRLWLWVIIHCWWELWIFCWTFHTSSWKIDAWIGSFGKITVTLLYGVFDKWLFVANR